MSPWQWNLTNLLFLQHPAVSECCVLGLPDKDYGEAVSAIVVPNAELKKRRKEELKPAVSLEELCTWAKERLAPYKVLHYTHPFTLSFPFSSHLGLSTPKSAVFSYWSTNWTTRHSIMLSHSEVYCLLNYWKQNPLEVIWKTQMLAMNLLFIFKALLLSSDEINF